MLLKSDNNMASKLIVLIGLLAISTSFANQSRESRNFQDDIITSFLKLKLYVDSPVNFVEFPLTSASRILEHPAFNINYKTVVYLPTLKSDTSNETVRDVAGAYLRRGDHNVILLDWKEMASDDRKEVVKKIPVMGQSMALALETMIEYGLDMTTVHLVGHSMGAHIAGAVGKAMRNHRIRRIVGLDPSNDDTPSALQTGDAEHVMILSTDSGFYGTSQRLGDANFIINGGFRFQPGCSVLVIPYSGSYEELCSHQRSVHIWAEAVKNQNIFVSVKCPSYLSFTVGMCRNNMKSLIGLGTSHMTKGTFYIKTGSETPYGLGPSGV